MKKKLLDILVQWPKSYISSGDIHPVLGGSTNSLHSLLKRATQEGILIRLKRDFYLIASKIQQVKPEAFEIAAILYGPSYISFESALSFHGWIPEAVPVVTSACVKRTRKMETFLGVFAYYYIPITIFHVGISTPYADNSKHKACFLIAHPWKAIADLIYVKKLSWPSAIALSNDLRIEIDLMQQSDISILEILAEKYPNNRVKKVLKVLAKDLSR